MDKYELKETIREIDNLISRHRFEEAADIADTVDWRKVRSVRILCRISDLYKINRRYEDSKRILELAYAKYPRGRQIIYSLCELELKLGNYVRALQLYNEYINVAPRDSDRYVLQYKLYKEQNVGIGERIAVLEELARSDYREKWAYELAKLYREAGEPARCIAECDELVAFFGEGRYVRRALELKKSITELTPTQEEAYERMKGRGGKPEAEKGEEEEKDKNKNQKESPVETEQEDFTEEVPELERQAALLQRDKKAANPPGGEEAQENFFDEGSFHVNPLEESRYSAEAMKRTIVRGLQDLNNYDDYLSQETDGQYKMVMEENPEPERQVAGQLNLEEIMSEWEKVRRDFYETNGFDPGEPPVRVQNGRRHDNSDNETEVPGGARAVNRRAGTTGAGSSPGTDSGTSRGMNTGSSPGAEAGSSRDVNAGSSPGTDSGDSRGVNTGSFPHADAGSSLGADTGTKSWDRREVHKALEIRDDDAKGGDGFDTSMFVTEGGGEFPAEFAVERSDAEESQDYAPAGGDLRQKRMYLHSQDSIRQLTDALELVRLDGGRGNVIITGDEGAGTLSMARELVRRFRRKSPNFVGQIAKSEGQYITRENVASVIPRMPFGALIIEHAVSMSEEGTAALRQMLNMPDRSILVILIDRKGVMDAFLSDHSEIREMFPARIDIASLSVDTLLGYAREYAGKQQCDIDEYGINALESRILSMQTIEHSVTLEDIRNIVDEAIYYANRKSLSTLVDSISRRRGTGSIRTVLRDKDFLHY